jgi:hypothetical protein
MVVITIKSITFLLGIIIVILAALGVGFILGIITTECTVQVCPKCSDCPIPLPPFPCPDCVCNLSSGEVSESSSPEIQRYPNTPEDIVLVAVIEPECNGTPEMTIQWWPERRMCKRDFNDDNTLWESNILDCCKRFLMNVQCARTNGVVVRPSGLLDERYLYLECVTSNKGAI